MIYTEHFEVSSHDTDRYDVARPSALLRYMQEAANHQMRDCKPSYMDLYNDGKAFLLSRIAVVTHAPLHAYDKIDVQTWPCTSSRGASFDRCYRILRQGELIAEGQALWACVDIHTRKLYRVTDIDLTNYHHADLIPVDGLRFHVDDDLTQVGAHTVAYHETDVNAHLNNTHYPDLLLDHLPTPTAPTLLDFSIHYRHEAKQNETLTLLRSSLTPTASGTRCTFRTTLPDGTVNIEAQVTLREV